MVGSDLPSKNEVEIQMQKRITELEKANQVLQVEILETRQKEYRINRYNIVSGGINRIFGSVVKAETEEELGNACLSVTLEVTGSQFGFIGEVGSDGLLHDIAISDMGWAQCLMYDKKGHRRPPGDFILHGLYGRVIDSGKGFFTNDPQSHPDSIGLPHGHPPLMSFLGVPLTQDGKVIGMITVANREGGYNFEQQEDLEAIAPAVVQALKSKKEEQKRKRAERKLALAHSQIQSIIDNTPDIIYAFDPEERFILANISVANVLNSTPDQMIGKRRHEFMPKMDADWHEANDRQVFEAGKVLEFEEYSHLKDRSITWLTKKFPLRDAQERIYAIAGISADITERKKAEEALRESELKYRTLSNTLEEKVKERTEELEKAYNSLKESETSLADAQEMAHIGNWIRDLVTGEVHWSDEVYRIFGFEPQEFGINYESFLSRVHPEDRDYVTNKVKKSLSKLFYDLEYRIFRADNEERALHENVKVVCDKENNPIQLKGTVQDITERKKAQETLEKIETVRKKEIHHRIKNNLQVISSLLDLQAEKFIGREDIKDSQVLEAFKESQDRVISMALIHEELHKGGEINTLNFSKYIKKLADNLLLTYRLGNESTSLNTDIEEDIFFDMDVAVPLGIIINELVSNSLKHAFSGRNKGKIQIKLKREKNGEYEIKGCNPAYVLLISDNGIGIPKSIDIKKLDSLGMQLVTSLVDQLDGEFELKRDKGTEFIIRFTVKGI